MQVRCFNDAAATVEKLAQDWLELADRRQQVHISLSGGSTPKQLFEFIVGSSYLKAIDWQHLHFWWGDERCVAPECSDSNYGVAERLLFRHTDIPDENIHRIHGEWEPEKARKQFAKDMSKALAIVNGFPQFDWILLGIGEDGHTASLFPGQTNYFEEESAVVALHPQSQQARVSITAPVIETARRVTYLALGESKKEILPKVMRSKSQALDFPAGRLHSIEGMTEYYLDKAAAQGLPPNLCQPA